MKIHRPEDEHEGGAKQFLPTPSFEELVVLTSLQLRKAGRKEWWDGRNSCLFHTKIELVVEESSF